jgi:formate dehydrogenase beta subunit
VFFGGDAAFGPKNIIWAVAHGHEAAVSIDRFLQRRGPRPSARRRTSTWSQPEDGHPRVELRQRHFQRSAPQGAAARRKALANIKVEVELGFDPQPPPSRRRSAA